MKKSVSVSLFLVLVVIALFSCTAQVPKADLKTAVDSISYAQGIMYASQVEQIFMSLGLDSANKADYIKGFKEGFARNEKDKKAIAIEVGQWFGLQYSTQFVPYFNQQLFGGDSTQTMSKKNFLAGYLASVVNDSTAAFTVQDAQAYSMSTTELIRKASIERQYAEPKKENEEWLEKNKSEEGVVVLPSGLQYKVVTEGKGAKPAATDVVKVNYKGTNIKDEVFDSNEGSDPRQFSLNGVIKGWTEGIQLMPVGSKYIFYIPSDLAYGEQERSAEIQPFSTLIFEVELLEIIK
ncbi:MAG: FKBP-type peptidyl-prolyl cis-trans isomerase [Dysgonamonadaceae bacterium]|jgi:FKBP-type peptidyl-prolyl cis-trans isomerase FklB|nr:FKBP-type peptidyl-prolyl cis-trans isomerase [Dysgonamonadaceae bacterium]